MCDGAPEPAKKKLWRIKRQSNPTAINEDHFKEPETSARKHPEKIQAQEAYYSIKEGGMSSAYRRTPVKARLGLISFGPNTKKRLKSLNNAMNPSGSTTNNPIRIKRLPVNLAQATVDRSRARNNILQTSTPNKVRLRRYMSGPQNVRVEVVNNTCMLPQFKYKRFKQILNHDLQLEIRQLQQRAAPTKKYWIQKVTPVSTNIKMQDRFAQLR